MPPNQSAVAPVPPGLPAIPQTIGGYGAVPPPRLAPFDQSDLQATLPRQFQPPNVERTDRGLAVGRRPKNKSPIQPWMVIVLILVIAVIIALVVAMSGPNVQPGK